MTILYALIFGILQGVTEFLPVSSSGHLALFTKLFISIPEEQILTYTVAAHAGTLLAVIFVLRKEISSLLSINRRVIVLLVLGSLPAAALGLLGESLFTRIASNWALLAICFIISALFLLTSPKEKIGAKELSYIRFSDALLIGIAQGIAILPGVSRSGSTISAALKRELTPAAAVAFSLLLGLISVGGATILEARQIGVLLIGSSAPVLFTSFISAFAVGSICIKLLMAVCTYGKLRYFAYYLIILSLLCVVFHIFMR